MYIPYTAKSHFALTGNGETRKQLISGSDARDLHTALMQAVYNLTTSATIRKQLSTAQASYSVRRLSELMYALLDGGDQVIMMAADAVTGDAADAGSLVSISGKELNHAIDSDWNEVIVEKFDRHRNPMGQEIVTVDAVVQQAAAELEAARIECLLLQCVSGLPAYSDFKPATVIEYIENELGAPATPAGQAMIKLLRQTSLLSSDMTSFTNAVKAMFMSSDDPDSPEVDLDKFTVNQLGRVTNTTGFSLWMTAVGNSVEQAFENLNVNFKLDMQSIANLNLAAQLTQAQTNLDFGRNIWWNVTSWFENEWAVVNKDADDCAINNGCFRIVSGSTAIYDAILDLGENVSSVYSIHTIGATWYLVPSSSIDDAYDVYCAKVIYEVGFDRLLLAASAQGAVAGDFAAAFPTKIVPYTGYSIADTSTDVTNARLADALVHSGESISLGLLLLSQEAFDANQWYADPDDAVGRQLRHQFTPYPEDEHGYPDTTVRPTNISEFAEWATTVNAKWDTAAWVEGRLVSYINKVSDGDSECWHIPVTSQHVGSVTIQSDATRVANISTGLKVGFYSLAAIAATATVVAAGLALKTRATDAALTAIRKVNDPNVPLSEVRRAKRKANLMSPMAGSLTTSNLGLLADGYRMTDLSGIAVDNQDVIDEVRAAKAHLSSLIAGPAET